MEREVGIICATLLSDVPNATLVSKEVLYKKEKNKVNSIETEHTFCSIVSLKWLSEL